MGEQNLPNSKPELIPDISGREDELFLHSFANDIATNPNSYLMGLAEHIPREPDDEGKLPAGESYSWQIGPIDEKTTNNINKYFGERLDLAIKYDPETDDVIKYDPEIVTLIDVLKTLRSKTIKAGNRVKHEENPDAISTRDLIRRRSFGIFVMRVFSWTQDQTDRKSRALPKAI